MGWIPLRRKPPDTYKKVWISYVLDRIYTKQEQVSAKIVGKDSDGNLLWHNFETQDMLDNSRFTVTHWMDTPDNPVVSRVDMK